MCFRIAYIGQAIRLCTKCAGGMEGQAKQDGDPTPAGPHWGIEPAGMGAATKIASISCANYSLAKCFGQLGVSLSVKPRRYHCSHDFPFRERR